MYCKRKLNFFSDAAMGTSSRHFRAQYWFNTIFFRGINMVINNVWCIKKFFGCKLSVASVREEIALTLLQSLEKKHVENVKLLPKLYYPVYMRAKKGLDIKRLDNNGHWPDQAVGRSMRCVCHLNRMRTSFFCVKCKVFLHPGICFKNWHTKVDYIVSKPGNL